MTTAMAEVVPPNRFEGLCNAWTSARRGGSPAIPVAALRFTHRSTAHHNSAVTRLASSDRSLLASVTWPTIAFPFSRSTR